MTASPERPRDADPLHHAVDASADADQVFSVRVKHIGSHRALFAHMQLLLLALLAVALLGPHHAAARKHVVLDDEDEDEVPGAVHEDAGERISGSSSICTKNLRSRYPKTKKKSCSRQNQFAFHCCCGWSEARAPLLGIDFNVRSDRIKNIPNRESLLAMSVHILKFALQTTRLSRSRRTKRLLRASRPSTWPMRLCRNPSPSRSLPCAHSPITDVPQTGKKAPRKSKAADDSDEFEYVPQPSRVRKSTPPPLHAAPQLNIPRACSFHHSLPLTATQTSIWNQSWEKCVLVLVVAE